MVPGYKARAYGWKPQEDKFQLNRRNKCLMVELFRDGMGCFRKEQAPCH